jgi:hypothetical protein
MQVFTLNSEQTPEQIKSILLNLDISQNLKVFVQSAFRVRVKFRQETNQNTLQIRNFPTTEIMDLEEDRINLQNFLKSFGIDLVVLDYEDCCMQGCLGCQNFEKEMYQI